MAMFLARDQTLVRGNEARGWELSDMFLHDYETHVVGPDKMYLMGFCMDESKCNQVG